jgi:hypothetical protein
MEKKGRYPAEVRERAVRLVLEQPTPWMPSAKPASNTSASMHFTTPKDCVPTGRSTASGHAIFGGFFGMGAGRVPGVSVTRTSVY